MPSQTPSPPISARSQPAPMISIRGAATHYRVAADRGLPSLQGHQGHPTGISAQASPANCNEHRTGRGHVRVVIDAVDNIGAARSRTEAAGMLGLRESPGSGSSASARARSPLAALLMIGSPNALKQIRRSGLLGLSTWYGRGGGSVTGSGSSDAADRVDFPEHSTRA